MPHRRRLRAPASRRGHAVRLQQARLRSRGAGRRRLDLSTARRETGKALGVAPIILYRVANAHHWFDSKADLLTRFAEAGANVEAPMNQ